VVEGKPGSRRFHVAGLFGCHYVLQMMRLHLRIGGSGQHRSIAIA
jgi:hypothetical protein